MKGTTFDGLIALSMFGVAAFLALVLLGIVIACPPAGLMIAIIVIPLVKVLHTSETKKQQQQISEMAGRLNEEDVLSSLD